MVSIAPQTRRRAVLCRRAASPGELEVVELVRPTVADDGLLVRVHASSANPVDLIALSPVGQLMRRRKPVVVGTDFAGTVEAKGRDVTAFTAGDEGFGAARGAFAEYVSIAASAPLGRKPGGVSLQGA